MDIGCVGRSHSGHHAREAAQYILDRILQGIIYGHRAGGEALNVFVVLLIGQVSGRSVRGRRRSGEFIHYHGG